MIRVIAAGFEKGVRGGDEGQAFGRGTPAWHLRELTLLVKLVTVEILANPLLFPGREGMERTAV